jgi:hypothetical protein
MADSTIIDGPMTLPRLTVALFLGTLAGMIATTLFGACLVHGARLDQAARSARLHGLGVPAVPPPAVMAALTWRDDLAGGMFYGLSAGWPLGGTLAVMTLGLGLGPRPRMARPVGFLGAGLLLALLLVDRVALAPTLTFALALPWVVGWSVCWLRRPGRA